MAKDTKAKTADTKAANATTPTPAPATAPEQDINPVDGAPIFHAPDEDGDGDE